VLELEKSGDLFIILDPIESDDFSFNGLIVAKQETYTTRFQGFYLVTASMLLKFPTFVRETPHGMSDSNFTMVSAQKFPVAMVRPYFRSELPHQ